ncbi:MAG: hypothetical protein M2R45_00825 [Verrucomicrobia subdivision 3 bacterium]|nr:hypothetical protein [Limisphaerales bacterium]MCS1413069.1 hypothetical protein [Limisphaerales bacterium]
MKKKHWLIGVGLLAFIAVLLLSIGGGYHGWLGIRVRFFLDPMVPLGAKTSALKHEIVWAYDRLTNPLRAREEAEKAEAQRLTN